MNQIRRFKNKYSLPIKVIRGECIDKISQLLLLLTKGFQKQRFQKYSNQCMQQYTSLRQENISKYITKAWAQKVQVMERLILPTPVFSFLRNSEIKATMFLSGEGDSLKGELNFCENFYSKKLLKQLLQEDYVGNPIIKSFKYLTSHNRIHHLYHLLQFQLKTKKKINSLKDFIEWGGGYGDLVRLLYRINSDITYTIIDIPLFSCIQWIYLVSLLGEEQVNLIKSKEDRIEKFKINLLPVCFLEYYDLKSDTFIATWSLSESSNYAIQYVKSCNFFNVKHLLLAYQEKNDSFPNAKLVGEIAISYGAEEEDHKFFGGNYYAFK